MRFEVSARLDYEVLASSTVLLNIKPLPSANQLLLEETFQATPPARMRELYSETGEKRFCVIEVPDAGNISFSYAAQVETRYQVLPGEHLTDVPISQMPAQVLSYLSPSRYCQSDRLYKFAAHHFGHLHHAFEKVLAICDWIYAHVEYSGGHTTPQTSAFDTITEQVGVCRDFAHLGVALCRALTIPARYFTCYAYRLQPPDFHACFEAYLGGHWVVFDATRMVPLNGLLKIATGADAAETAFASTFGNLSFQNLQVKVEALEPGFHPVNSSPTHGFSYSW
ncbi:transglutaminase-like domain-containing protein [Sabulibacter ruber]|uniref:transglutaminase-like domain-containing protein n=1 Tax=Sabulibacter ruber TaxID=2811901 RepID=UPI001A96D4F3|nr:transglutaminase family protein [Sabulibacter ruber]